MHIHLQNTPGDALFAFSRQMWEDAAARAPDIGTGHHVTIGETEADLHEALRTAEALVCDAGIIRIHIAEAATKPDAPRLRLLFATNAGLDRLAPFDWLPDGMILMNNRGTHDAKSGEFAIMSVLMLVNRIPEMVTNQRAGRWQKIWGSVLSGRRLTIVGLGTLGGATARNAAGFGMRVTGVRVNPRPHPHCSRVVGTADLDAVLPDTDVLVLACPLTDATRGLMDRRRLSLLPQGAGLVNIARGEVVDQDAVCDLLEIGHLGGAVLDVFTPEPIPDGHRLWTTPNLVISPHTSADDPATYNPHSLDIFLENLRAWRDGRPMPNRFDVARGY
ncbi:MAG: D-2-hydroxyacid dehydrogenase [Rhodospirillales bacterium]|nr:D-2-hydroxyacid dehydrogenase [Rhodospirillales bacterium]